LSGDVDAANPAKERREDLGYWSVVENRRVVGGKLVQRHILARRPFPTPARCKSPAWYKWIEVFDGTPNIRGH
jgi:hypothetical protein